LIRQFSFPRQNKIHFFKQTHSKYYSSSQNSNVSNNSYKWSFLHNFLIPVPPTFKNKIKVMFRIAHDSPQKTILIIPNTDVSTNSIKQNINVCYNPPRSLLSQTNRSVFNSVKQNKLPIFKSHSNQLMKKMISCNWHFVSVAPNKWLSERMETLAFGDGLLLGWVRLWAKSLKLECGMRQNREWQF